MRLKRSRQTILYLYNRTVGKDAEGGTYESFPESGAELRGEWWAASGKLQADLYGQRLPYIRNIRLDEPYRTETDEKGRVFYTLLDSGETVREGDRVGLEADRPHYRILSIRPDRFLRIEVEAVVQ